MNNLNEKIGILIKEIDRLPNYEKLVYIKRFIENELGYIEAEHKVQIHDLANIHSDACKFSTDLSPHTVINGTKIINNSGMTQAYCYMQAVYSWMRGKGMTKFMLDFKGDRQE